jgi:hypothetical protein
MAVKDFSKAAVQLAEHENISIADARQMTAKAVRMWRSGDWSPVKNDMREVLVTVGEVIGADLTSATPQMVQAFTLRFRDLTLKYWAGERFKQGDKFDPFDDSQDSAVFDAVAEQATRELLEQDRLKRRIVQIAERLFVVCAPLVPCSMPHEQFMRQLPRRVRRKAVRLVEALRRNARRLAGELHDADYNQVRFFKDWAEELGFEPDQGPASKAVGMAVGFAVCAVDELMEHLRREDDRRKRYSRRPEMVH